MARTEESSQMIELRNKIFSPESISEPGEIEGEEGLLPDFRGRTMREVLKKARALGVKVVLEGTGLAFRQVPDPGSSLSRISAIKVSFRPPL